MRWKRPGADLDRDFLTELGFEKMKQRAKFAVDTKVPVNQTRAEIEEVLTKFGATSFVCGIQGHGATVIFECNARRIRFDLPLPPLSETKHAKEHRQRWRALLLSIKAKLVSVDTEIETFEEAFLAHVVLADGSTVGQMTRPAIEQQYETGKMVSLLGPPT
jgi:hypothetical protein